MLKRMTKGNTCIHKCATVGEWMDLVTGYHYEFAYTSSSSARFLPMTHLLLRIERSRDLLIRF
jgi:hypothetical protein